MCKSSPLPFLHILLVKLLTGPDLVNDSISAAHPALAFPSSGVPPKSPRESLQLVVIRSSLIVLDRRLDRLRSLARHALSLVDHAAGSFRSSLGGLAHALGVGKVSLVVLLGDPGVDAVLALLLDEVGQALDGAVAAVLEGRGLAARGVQLDGREALDLVGDVVGRGVDLGDRHLTREVGVGLVEFAELLVLGGETGIVLAGDSIWKVRKIIRFAVAAPWCVELDQNVLAVVEDNVLVVLSNDNSDRAVVLLGNGLALDRGLNLAGKVVTNKSPDVLLCKLIVLVEGEFLVLGDILDRKRRKLVSHEVEVTSVSSEGFGVDGGEVDRAFVLLSDRLERGSELLAFLWSLGEDVCEGQAGLVLLVKFVDEHSF